MSNNTPTTSDVRSKGQVWTPPWVADVMANYLIADQPLVILDPAVGPGALLAACRRQSIVDFEGYGYEIDEKVLSSSNSIDTYLVKTKNRFLESYLDAKCDPAPAIIANPPYLRHHRIPQSDKVKLKTMSKKLAGLELDGRAGLHIYFLVKSVLDLAEGGRLSYLLPADVFEGVFSNALWNSIHEVAQIDFVITFGNEGSAPFPGVDTNACIVMLQRKSNPDEINKNYVWMNWTGAPDSSFLESFKFARHAPANGTTDSLFWKGGTTTTAIEVGLHHDPSNARPQGIALTDFVDIKRGIATGSNEFFGFTRAEIEEHGLDLASFRRCIFRVRDLKKPFLDESTLNELDSEGRPTYLLYLDGESPTYPNLERYLDRGVKLGVANGALVKTRKNWWWSEKRETPAILFTYLGRRKNRFVPVVTDVVPSTAFACIYPKPGVNVKKLLEALNSPEVLGQLTLFGKSYGGGAVKVEPGGLRKILIPDLLAKNLTS